MEAGVSDHAWSVEEIVRLLEGAMMKGTRQWILAGIFAMLAGFRFLDRTPGRWPPRFFTIIVPVIGVALGIFLTGNWIRARNARERARRSDQTR